MLSVDANEMETRSSESLVVPKIRKSKSRAMSKLEKAGKNDSVKSSYSLSVFIDPNASKDMGRQEELWYTMYEPERSEGDSDKNRLVSENEMERLKSKDLRNGVESVASVNSQQTSDNERFFRENAVTVGAGTGSAPGKNSDGDSGEFRGNSKATHEEDVEATGDENVTEEEAMRTHRDLLAPAPRQGHRHHGTRSSSASEAADEEEEEHNHRHLQLDYAAQGLRGDVEHANSDSGSEGADDQQNEWQTGQPDAVNFSRSRPGYEENAEEQRTSEVRTSKGQGYSSANSVNDGGAAAYQSSIQGRHSTGYLRQRTGSSRAAPADSVNSSILTKRIGIDYRDSIGNAEEEENEYLTLTEGSDEDPYARSTHRQVAKGRRRIARAAPAEAGEQRPGADATSRPTRYESLSSSTSVNSAPRKNHSSAAAHDEGEFSTSSQRRRRTPIAKRERIQRKTTQGEAQDSSPDDRAATPTEHPSNYARASSDDDYDEVGQLNSLGDRPMPASRLKSSRSGADSVQRPAQMYSSEEEHDEDSARRRQGTNRGDTEAGRFSRQTASDEENERYEVTNSSRDISMNRRPAYSTSSSRTTSDSHDYEMYNPNAQRDLNKSTYYDNNNSATQNDYQPRPTQRTKKGLHDSLSSMDYSSSNEVYHPKTYNPRNVKPRSSAKDTDGRFGSADNQLSYQNFEDQSSSYTGYAQGRGSYPDSALGPPIQPRKGVRQNPTRVADNSSESSLSQEQRSQFRRRPMVNDQVIYSDDSDSDDHSTRPGQKVVVDFGSESDSSSSVPDETEHRRKSRTSTTTKTTTVVKKTATPVRGVLTVDETASPQPSPRTVRREIRTVTTPVTGVVSIDDSAVVHPHRKTSSMTRTTPVEGLISVHHRHSRSHQEERTKTPVVGLITPRESQTHSVLRSSTVTPVRGVINVGRTPSPERSKTPVVGLISTRRPLSSASMNQLATGDINVITSRSVRNRPTISSSTVKSDINDNLYRQSHLYPRQVKYNLNTSIDSVLVPTTPDSKEIVGVDPELRRAQKTGTNYRITMNLRPFIDDVSDVGGYEMHNAMVMRSATPSSAVRSRPNSRRATDWDLNSEYLQRSGSRASNPMTMGNTLGRSVSRTPSNQFRYESNTETRFGPYSAWDGNSFQRPRSSSLFQERVVRPDSQSAYWMDPGRGDTLTDPRAWVNRPTSFHEVSRHASSTFTDRSRPRSMAEQRHDLHFSQPQMVNVKPIHQTVTSRPIGLRSVGQDRLTVKGPHGRAFNGHNMLPKSHSSSMSSVFLSPTLDRRANRNARVQSNFRNDTYQRLGHFN